MVGPPVVAGVARLECYESVTRELSSEMMMSPSNKYFTPIQSVLVKRLQSRVRYRKKRKISINTNVLKLFKHSSRKLQNNF